MMWKDVLMISGSVLTIICLIDYIYIVLKRIKNLLFVSEKVCVFRHKIRSLPIITICILITNLVVFLYARNNEVAEREVFLQMNFNENEIFIEIIMICILLLVGCVFLSIYLKPVMYEEGILCSSGEFLYWESIKSIKTFVGRDKKYILIKNLKNKDIYLRIYDEELKDIKEIIFNKSGIVNKDIVTECC